MQLLILGGTLFLGRHLVEIARARGHEVTLFNRGQTAPELFPNVEQLRGDRERDLSALRGRSWDAVVDTSGYIPRVVGASAALLADRVEHYTFVSSISAYGTFPQLGMTEDARVAELPDPSAEDVAEHYGALKVACERAVDAALTGRACSVRAGLIVGPHDPTERFTYWVRRLAEGGRVLAPRPSGQPVQLIDARDLAAWILDGAQARRTGLFNATGPAEPLTLGALLERTRQATGGRAELAWVDEDALVAAGVEPWDELPLWLAPSHQPDFRGFLAVDISRALAAGLTFRPLEDTVTDTLDWVRERSGPPRKTVGVPVPLAGLSPEREAALLGGS